MSYLHQNSLHSAVYASVNYINGWPAQIFKYIAGRHAQKVATEVLETFDKVHEETADTVEEFLARCEWMIYILTYLADTFSFTCTSLAAAPKFSEVVQDTKFFCSNLEKD